MFQLSANVPNLPLNPKSSPMSNHLIDDMSAGCLTNRHSHIALTHLYLTENFNRPTHVALPRFCDLHTKVWNVRK